MVNCLSHTQGDIMISHLDFILKRDHKYVGVENCEPQLNFPVNINDGYCPTSSIQAFSIVLNPTCTWDISGGAGVSLGQTKIIAHHHHRLQISLSPAHIILVQISPNPGNIFTDVDDLVMIMVCNGSGQNLTPHFDRLLLFLSETVLLYYWARSIPSSL